VKAMDKGVNAEGLALMSHLLESIIFITSVFQTMSSVMLLANL